MAHAFEQSGHHSLSDGLRFPGRSTVIVIFGRLNHVSTGV